MTEIERNGFARLYSAFRSNALYVRVYCNDIDGRTITDGRVRELHMIYENKAVAVKQVIEQVFGSTFKTYTSDDIPLIDFEGKPILFVDKFSIDDTVYWISKQDEGKFDSIFAESINNYKYTKRLFRRYENEHYSSIDEYFQSIESKQED